MQPQPGVQDQGAKYSNLKSTHDHPLRHPQLRHRQKITRLV